MNYTDWSELSPYASYISVKDINTRYELIAKNYANYTVLLKNLSKNKITYLEIKFSDVLKYKFIEYYENIEEIKN